MKRLLMITIICTCTISICADNYLGVQFGFAQPTTYLNAPQPADKTVLNPMIYNGFKVGMVYETDIIKGFGVIMGLNYTFGVNFSNWKSVGAHPHPKTCDKTFYHQLEIPVDWQYKFEIAQDTWIILYTGPTLQCGLAMTRNEYETDKYGKVKETVGISDIYSTESNKDNALKRINVTWGIGAGFQYDRYFLRGGYDFGLINPYASQTFAGQDVYTRGRFDQWQIKLGIYFWQGR
jgi:hypothetical protein